MVIAMNENISSRTKRIVGDGKRIMLRTNSDSLLVIGSGNLVQVERNDGDIEVIGDGCHVSVTTGNGTIRYCGDGGYLQTGSMDLSKIRYTGDGGRIVSSHGSPKTTHKCTTHIINHNRKEANNDFPSDSTNNIKTCDGNSKIHENKKKHTGKNIFVDSEGNYEVTIKGLKSFTSLCANIPKVTIVNKCKHK